MITRDEAIAVLTELVEDNVLNDELRELLDDIRITIHYEKVGLHLWGADEGFEEKLEEYVFAPSDREEEDIMNEGAKYDEEMLTSPTEDEKPKDDKLPN